MLVCTMGWSQINDHRRAAASSKKASKSNSNSSSGSSNSSGGSGLSSGDLSLLIDACGCLYNVGIPFFSEVVVKGIQNNTTLIKAKRDSLPRIKNLEFSIGYGAFPDADATYIPKLRMQAGLVGTSFRSFITQDKKNPFLMDLLTDYSWQVLEFNYLNREHITIRSGIGALYDTYAKLLVTEIGTSTDIFLKDDMLRINLEARYTPFGEEKFRKELMGRLYLRPSDKDGFHFELFGGGFIGQYSAFPAYWKLELGAGFMLY